MQGFILNIKVPPEASLLLSCSISYKSWTLPCPQGYCCRSDDQLIPLNTHLYQEAHLLLGGLVARIAVPFRESPEWHNTSILCTVEKILKCTLHFHRLPTIQCTSEERESWGKKTAEAVGKRLGFRTSDFLSSSSLPVWASSVKCLKLS